MEKIIQRVFLVSMHKNAADLILAKGKGIQKGGGFCSSKLSVKQPTHELKRSRLPVEEIHSDPETGQTGRGVDAFSQRTLIDTGGHGYS